MFEKLKKISAVCVMMTAFISGMILPQVLTVVKLNTFQ
jgi:hypothetical protein